MPHDIQTTHSDTFLIFFYFTTFHISKINIPNDNEQSPFDFCCLISFENNVFASLKHEEKMSVFWRLPLPRLSIFIYHSGIALFQVPIVCLNISLMHIKSNSVIYQKKKKSPANYVFWNFHQSKGGSCMDWDQL